MLKKTIFFLLLSSAQSHLFAQTTNELSEHATYLQSILESANTDAIPENWHLEKGQTIDLENFLHMQSDAFGKMELAQKMYLENIIIYKNKSISLTALFDSTFTNDRSAQLTIDIFKGKKKKDPYKIVRASIRSKTDKATPFIDSLCAEPLQKIRDGKFNELTNDIFMLSQLENLSENSEDMNPKDREALELATQFAHGLAEMLQGELNNIDKTIEPSYAECSLSTRKGTPELTITYHFQGVEGTQKAVTLGYRLTKNKYHLTNIGVGGPIKSSY